MIFKIFQHTSLISEVNRQYQKSQFLNEEFCLCNNIPTFFAIEFVECCTEHKKGKLPNIIADSKLCQPISEK
jgi:hypothetical protein